MTSKQYYQFKKLLEAGHEDQEVAMAGLKNSKPSLVQRMLLGKSLNNHARYKYLKLFPEVEAALTPWEDLFEYFKKLKPTNDEKVLIELEFSNSFVPVIEEHYKFIKNMKVELKW
tara:strand:+ start:585 stop:929 length:345 start_codon:yes stop_codon:yes gene_type:complete